MKKVISMVALSLLCAVGAKGEMKSSISQYGITWTFDKSYECGQFVNGDWWVKGPAVVQSVNPAPSGGRHGSMIDPRTGFQSYDDRVNGYAITMLAKFPATLQPDQSLVSAISFTSFGCTMRGGQGEGYGYDLNGVCKDDSKIKTAAVLTCVAEAKSANTFRPQFSKTLQGVPKKYYTTDQINTDLIPSLAPVTGIPTDLTYYLRGLERPWIMHNTDWGARALHPMENMLGYHKYVYGFAAGASVLLLVDLPAAAKTTLIHRYIQLGIDKYGMCLSGHGSSAMVKVPVIIAGLLLGDTEMANFEKNGISKTPFRTDWMTYYRHEAESNIKSSKIASNAFYHGFDVGWRQDPGCAEHEHLDPTEWDLIETTGCLSGGGSKRETYRGINSPQWPGLALTTLFFGAKELYDHPAFFDYSDRWKDGENKSTGNEFIDNMWAAYRDKVPAQTGIIKNREPVTVDRIEITGDTFYSIEGKTITGKRMRNGVYLYPRTTKDGRCLLERFVFVK